MQTNPSTSDEHRKLVAVYETYERARSARDELTAAGIPASDIDVLDAREGGWRADEGQQSEGFWGALKRMFVPEEEETHSYAEGLRRGHAMLVVRPTADMHARATEVLEGTEPLDFDAQVSQWRNEGWAGRYDESTAGSATWSGRDDAAPVGAPSASVASTSGASTGTGGALGTTGMDARAMTSDAATGAGEQRIPLAEERLRVGKREVSGGSVRVRSYVVERPVEEQVRLREESVNVDRRAVDRPVSDTDDPFRERTIEVSARSEEAVIGKDARVREEVVVRKDAGERTETVKDTVRRTEVEVEDGSATSATTRAATPGSTTSGFATPDAATPEAATADTGMTPTPGTDPTGTETPAGKDAESGRPSPEKGTVKR
jgi:uncharacterized protein (TIGR02271 family)